jgi:hypothetical protein
MSQGLSVSNLVNVTVSLTPSGVAELTFGVLMIAGDSNVINGTQRFRSYTAIGAVATDFGITAPEYLAAQLFFSQSPQPAQCMVGRWIAANTAALNDGGILSSTQQTLALWTAIASGGFDMTIDGAALTVTGLNFTAQTNLNGVASVITAGITSAGGTATCTWNGTNFVITSGTTGLGLQATGTVTFTGTTTANDTLTLNGRTITFVSSAPSTHQVLIGATSAATAANLQLYLNANAAADSDLNVATYSTLLSVLTITYGVVGTAGNSFAMSKSSTNITLSAADLAGGTVSSSVGFATSPASGTDISTMLQMTSGLAQALVPAFNSESPAACASALANASSTWYGLMFAALTSITDTQYVAVAAFIQAQTITRLFGATTQETGALSSLVTNDLGSQLQALGYSQSFTQYSSTNPYAVASLFGRAFSVNFQGTSTTICLMFKQEPGVTAEVLTPAQATTLQAKNINVFVAYVNGTFIIQFGVVANGQYIDTIQGVDWLQNAIQTAVFNVLYTTTTKIPQTDAGVTQITNSIGAACNEGVENGLIAGGTWNGPSFGQITTGQYLKTGFYIYAQSVALQPQANRAARICPPIQVAVKLAGAIQEVLIAVNVNQ